MEASILQLSACTLTHAGEFTPEIRSNPERILRTNHRARSIKDHLRACYAVQESEGFDVRPD